jgi:hypothetical protein
LNKAKHTELELLSDWKQFGEQSFRMEVVFQMEDDLPVAAKRSMETFAMQRYKAAGLLYNKNEASFAPAAHAIAKARANQRRGFANTPESNEKRRLAQLGIPKGHGAKISATKQAKKLMR